MSPGASAPASGQVRGGGAEGPRAVPRSPHIHTVVDSPTRVVPCAVLCRSTWKSGVQGKCRSIVLRVYVPNDANRCAMTFKEMPACLFSTNSVGISWDLFRQII